MKNTRNFLFGALATSMFMFSCSKDNTDPVISAIETSGSKMADSVVTIKATFTDAEGLSKYKMTITKSDGSSIATDENTISGESYDYSYNFTVPTGGAGLTYVVSITVTDDGKDGGLTATATTNLEIGAANNLILTYSANTVHALVTSSSGNSSLYGLFTDAIYTTTTAASNQAAVDLVYYYGSTNFNTFAAPSDATVTGDGITTFNICTAWTTKNATKFEKITSVTSAQFSAATTDALFANLTVANNSKVTMLANNDIIAFETAAGKKGLIKIVTAPSANNGDLTFDVKIQD